MKITWQPSPDLVIDQARRRLAKSLLGWARTTVPGALNEVNAMFHGDTPLTSDEVSGRIQRGSQDDENVGDFEIELRLDYGKSARYVVYAAKIRAFFLQQLKVFIEQECQLVDAAGLRRDDSHGIDLEIEFAHQFGGSLNVKEGRVGVLWGDDTPVTTTPV